MVRCRYGVDVTFAAARSRYMVLTTVSRCIGNKSSAVEMGDRLATTIDMGRKWGAAVLLNSVGELGPHLRQCRLG